MQLGLAFGRQARHLRHQFFHRDKAGIIAAQALRLNEVAVVRGVFRRNPDRMAIGLMRLGKTSERIQAVRHIVVRHIGGRVQCRRLTVTDHSLVEQMQLLQRTTDVVMNIGIAGSEYPGFAITAQCFRQTIQPGERGTQVVVHPGIERPHDTHPVETDKRVLMFAASGESITESK